MIKILFVCLGNICRSPMAEYVFKDMINKRNLNNELYIDSAATSNEEIGNGIHYGTKNKLKEMNIKFGDHRARQITNADYEKFDYIIGMEERNVKDIIRICGNDTENKVYKLLDFSSNPRDIADPWYTGNFDITYDDVVEGLNGFMNHLLRSAKGVNNKNVSEENL